MKLRLRKFRSDMQPCVCGGTVAVAQRLRIDPKTLRRHYVTTCADCMDRVLDSPQQRFLREQRTTKDWREVTSPVEPTSIRPDEMPEQYPGRPRAALRAFMNSDATRAVVPGIDMATLQQTIAALGLTGQVYAEQRDNQTVIRRVSTST